LAPACSSSELAGTEPPSTASRSQTNLCGAPDTRPSPSMRATTTLLTAPRPFARTTVWPASSWTPASASCAAAGRSAASGRRSATASTGTPAA
jgi:hypothetical protein